MPHMLFSIILFAILFPVYSLAEIPSEIVIYPSDGEKLDERHLATLAHLQGLSARGNPQCVLYRVDGGNSEVLLKRIAKRHSLKVVRDMKFQDSLEKFGSKFSKYCLFSVNDNTNFNKIAMFAAANGALLIEESFASLPILKNWQKLSPDLSGDENDAIAALSGKLDFSAAANLKNSLKVGLRDYIAMRSIPVYWNDKIPDSIIKNRHSRIAPMFGFGNYEELSEFGFVSEYSRNGFYCLPSDYQPNLSVLGKFPVAPSDTAPRDSIGMGEELPAKSKLACMVMTDGDNLNFNTESMIADARWGAGPRNIPIGWGLNCNLKRLAPEVLAQYYDRKDGKRMRDSYTCQLGAGYAYPSFMGKEALADYAKKTAELMEECGLKILQVLDSEAFERDDIWKEFLKYPQIEAIIYLDYNPYHGANGRIREVCGKPVIGVRMSLWKDLPKKAPLCGSTDYEIAEAINSSGGSPDDLRTYSLICVHAWSKTVKDAQDLADKLDKDVKVVAPDVFVREIKKHLKKLSQNGSK